MGFHTDVGRQRQKNEDALVEVGVPLGYLLAVADGMGGHDYGDRAAIMAALMGTKDFRSLLGHTWSFNEEGDSTVQKMGLNQVQGGEIVYLQLIA